MTLGNSANAVEFSCCPGKDRIKTKVYYEVSTGCTSAKPMRKKNFYM